MITVLHVLEELSSFARSMAEDIIGEKRWAEHEKEKKSEVTSELSSRLEGFCNDVRRECPDCPFVIEKTIVETGHPVDHIVRLAQEMDIDLIVMGSRGKGGLADVTMGSTSRRVLRRCPKPVLVVRLPEDGNG